MFEWLNEDSRKFLSRGYLLEGVSPEERIRQIADRAQELLPKNPGFADKFYDYMGRGWFSLSSPVWSNFGLGRGYPVSCFSSYVDDSMENILYTVAEVGTMSKRGGGTSGYFGAVRGRGAPITDNGESEGSVHFMKLFDTVIDTTRQGSTRRGSFAAYLPIDHPDIEEFLQIKDAGNPIQNIYFAVTITDEWMQSMLDGDREKRRIWGKVLQARSERGVPYIFFYDTVNNSAPDVYKDKDMTIWGSNLCSEVLSATNPDESFTCVLSSLNLLHYDEWKDTDAVETLIHFLDAVNEEFVQKSEGVKFMERAHRFAKNQRSLGAGVLGWHSYLQSRMIPFESLEADLHNNIIFKNIRTKADAASRELAELYGEPELLKGYGRRNVNLISLAPTQSSSFILGQVSASIEPIKSNYMVQQKAKAVHVYKNPYLEALLEEKGKNTKAVWDGILFHDGSVQHLDWLTDHERNVFKTFSEISQLDVIVQAATRQRWIDHSQSLNLTIHSEAPAKDINELMIEAWKRGVKTLYYQFTTSAAQDMSRGGATNYDRDTMMTCSSCEG